MGKILLTHTDDRFPERVHEGVVYYKAACKVNMSKGKAANRRNGFHGLDHCRRSQLIEKVGDKEKSPPGNTTTFGTGITISAR
jgi:hypothetical protein